MQDGLAGDAPKRWMRSAAWFSTAGFHHGSSSITWLAAVRLRATPAATPTPLEVGCTTLSDAVVRTASRRGRADADWIQAALTYFAFVLRRRLAHASYFYPHAQAVHHHSGWFR